MTGEGASDDDVFEVVTRVEELQVLSNKPGNAERYARAHDATGKTTVAGITTGVLTGIAAAAESTAQAAATGSGWWWTVGTITAGLAGAAATQWSLEQESPPKAGNGGADPPEIDQHKRQ